MTKVLLGLVLCLSLGACGTQLNQGAGQALNQSFALIQPMADLGLDVRQADGTMTIAAFREQAGVTQISASERQFMTVTLHEHQQTIDSLIGGTLNVR